MTFNELKNLLINLYLKHTHGNYLRFSFGGIVR